MNYLFIYWFISVDLVRNFESRNSKICKSGKLKSRYTEKVSRFPNFPSISRVLRLAFQSLENQKPSQETEIDRKMENSDKWAWKPKNSEEKRETRRNQAITENRYIYIQENENSREKSQKKTIPEIPFNIRLTVFHWLLIHTGTGYTVLFSLLVYLYVM